MRRLKIGMLHGLYQNKSVFQQKTKLLREGLPGGVDLVYFNGPQQVVPPILRKGGVTRVNKRKPGVPESCEFRGWWDPSKSNNDIALDTTHLLKCVKNQLCPAPLDGLIGFSQGAALAALLCSNQARKVLDWSPAFVVVASGYESLIPQHQQFFQSGVDPAIQSLHIAGALDRVVPAGKGLHLSQRFESAKFIKHDKGHHFPDSSRVLEQITDFVEQLQRQLGISCP